MAVFEIDHGGHVHARIVADRGVRAAAGFHTDDAVGRQHALAEKELGILAGVDIVSDDGERDLVLEPLAEAEDAHRLPGTDRAADAKAERTLIRIRR